MNFDTFILSDLKNWVSARTLKPESKFAHKKEVMKPRSQVKDFNNCFKKYVDFSTHLIVAK